MSKLTKNEDAFTGLEAAIVLIAFVVVAAVFSYVVLGAGFFTTQKSQEVVHTGVAQASSSLEVSGPVTVAASSNAYLGSIYLYLQVAAGGTAVDMTKVTYTVSTSEHVYTFVDQDSADKDTYYPVTRTPVGTDTNDGDNLLENLEMIQITIPLTGSDAFPEGNKQIGVNNKFSLDIKPDVGAALPVARTAPAGLTKGHFYEVY